MVELKLQAADGTAVSNDLFVSVRVGEMQKLTKASKPRTYQFPASAVGDRRYGKIEVFKRIGGCSVHIDPASYGKSCEVNVPFEGVAAELAGSAGMLFHMLLGSENGKGATAEPDNLKPPNSARKMNASTNPKVAAAKEYVEQHNLEARLADAMQAVLKERPADPSEFIAAKLTGSKPPAGWRPPTKAPPPSKDVLPFGSYYTANFRSMGSGAFSKICEAFPQKTQTKKTLKPTSAILPFQAYYASSMVSCPAAYWENLHSKFPKYVKNAAPKTGSKVVGILPFEAYHKVNMASTPPTAWQNLYNMFPANVKAKDVVPLSRPSVVDVVPVPPYYNANVLSCPPACWQKLHAKFDNGAKTGAAAGASSPSGVGQMKWNQKPSIGSWLALRQRNALSG